MLRRICIFLNPVSDRIQESLRPSGIPRKENYTGAIRHFFKTLPGKDLLYLHLIRLVKVSACNTSIPGETDRYMGPPANMTGLAGQHYSLVQVPRNLKFGTAFEGLIDRKSVV